jgi:ABC-2 type transport system permease protein
MAWAVLDDRERYRTLKTVYVAPIDLRLYLIGRGVARFATGSISVAILLVVGVAAFELPIRPGAVNWPLFVVALLAGLVMLAAMGLLIASIVLLLTQFAWSLGDAVAGALFLFSGAVFPLDVLPAPLQPIGYALPLVYWLELIRRALAPPLAGAFPLAALSTWTLCGLLALMTGALAAAALVVFRRCDHLARERGLIDRTSNY